MKKQMKIRTLLLRELFLPLMALFLIFIIGFLGYIFIEHLSPLKSLYLLVITFATIGFGISLNLCCSIFCLIL
jgi:voltage-gated potassium channel